MNPENCHVGKTPGHLFLVGPRGSGKTTIGHSLARVRDLPFYDTDRMVEEVIREPISVFWSREGEKVFREIESSVLSRLSEVRPGVVSTGGGIVLTPSNRSAIMAMGWVLYLFVSLEVLESRLSHWGNTRPRLNKEVTLSEEIALTVNERDPLYREMADHTVETGGMSVPQVVSQISRLWEPGWANEGSGA